MTSTHPAAGGSYTLDPKTGERTRIAATVRPGEKPLAKPASGKPKTKPAPADKPANEEK